MAGAAAEELLQQRSDAVGRRVFEGEHDEVGRTTIDGRLRHRAQQRFQLIEPLGSSEEIVIEPLSNEMITGFFFSRLLGNGQFRDRRLLRGGAAGFACGAGCFEAGGSSTENWAPPAGFRAGVLSRICGGGDTGLSLWRRVGATVEGTTTRIGLPRSPGHTR